MELHDISMQAYVYLESCQNDKQTLFPNSNSFQGWGGRVSNYNFCDLILVWKVIG